MLPEDIGKTEIFLHFQEANSGKPPLYNGVG